MMTNCSLRNVVIGIFLYVLIQSPCMATDSVDGQKPLDVAKLEIAFQQKLDELKDKYGFPGATAAFVLPDGQTGVGATGFADVENAIPMKTDSVMLAGSIGKTFAAATVLYLAMDGTVNLDEKIEKWFTDDEWFQRLPNGSDITLRTLLNHRSGIENYAFDDAILKGQLRSLEDGTPYNPSNEEKVAIILGKDPLFPVGKGFHYTDTSYVLAGMVIERATGETYYELLQRHILSPLKLLDVYPSNRRDIPRITGAYMAEDNWAYMPTKVAEAGRLYYDPSFEWTGGGLATTALDLARWAKLLYEGKAMPFEGYLDELLGSTGEDPYIDEIDYGIGVHKYGLAVYKLQSSLGRVLGHGGIMQGFTSRVRYFRDYKTAVAIQVNHDMDENMRDYIFVLAGVIVKQLLAAGQTPIYFAD